MPDSDTRWSEGRMELSDEQALELADQLERYCQEYHEDAREVSVWDAITDLRGSAGAVIESSAVELTEVESNPLEHGAGGGDPDDGYH